MTDVYQRELVVAVAAVEQAARICRSVQSSITAELIEKKDRSPVTVADFCSQAIICKALHEEFPADPVVGEEEADLLTAADNQPLLERVVAELNRHVPSATAEDACDWINRGRSAGGVPRFWTLDPIDGTKGFLRKEQYAISLALIVDGQIVLGVVGCPQLGAAGNELASGDSRGTIFWAVRGGGAFQRPMEAEIEPTPIQVSAIDDPAQARFCESVESGHSAHGRSAELASRLNITREAVRLDSQAKYTVVARGDADLYLRLPTRAGYREKIWDHTGGVIVIEEAGGRVTDIFGQPLDFTQGRELTNNQGVIVTNGRFHDRVIAELQALDD